MELLQATVTCDPTAGAPESAHQLAQQLGRGTGSSGASGCHDQSDHDAQSKKPKPLRIAGLARVRDDASARESRPGRTRTRDKGIMSPLL